MKVLAIIGSPKGKGNTYRLGSIDSPYPGEDLPDRVERLRSKAAKDAEKAAKKFYAALCDKKPKAPGVFDLLQFRLRRKAFGTKGKIQTDHDYWNANGWLDKKKYYYYDVKVNPLKRAVAWAVFKIMGEFS